MKIETLEIMNLETGIAEQSKMYVFDENESIDWKAMGINTEKSEIEKLTGFTEEELLTCNELDAIQEVLENGFGLLCNPDTFEELKRLCIENVYNLEMFVYGNSSLFATPVKQKVEDYNDNFLFVWHDLLANNFLMNDINLDTLMSFYQVDADLHCCDSIYMLNIN